MEDFEGFYDDEDWDYDEDGDCTWCGGEGINDDPDWDEWDGKTLPKCKACGGTGLAKDQTLF